MQALIPIDSRSRSVVVLRARSTKEITATFREFECFADCSGSTVLRMASDG